MHRKRFFSLTFILFSLFIFVQDAHALFGLTVSPRRGGQSIRFDESRRTDGLLSNEEVTFTVTSTEGVQYRIFQTLFQPLTNEFGNTIPQGSLIMFSPSNALGTLRPQLETPVTMGQTPLYTSNSSGDSDSFVIVYNLKLPENQPGGTYRTSVTFTAEPVTPSSGTTSSSVTLDIRVELKPTYDLKIQNSKGGRNLDLGKLSQTRSKAEESLEIKIDSNVGTPFRIYQVFSNPLTSADGETLDENLLRFRLAGGQNGSLAASQINSVSPTQQLLYTSSNSGQGDQIEVQYEISSDDDLKAGIYNGTLSFRVDSNSPFVSKEIVNIPVHLEVESIFYLSVKMQEGTGIHFGTFKKPEDREQGAELVVHSNLGQPYIVSQVSRKLTNPEGAEIPEGYFKFMTSGAKTGQMAASSMTPVKEGESVLFTSDKLGTPEKLFVHYALSVPEDARGGD
jgi:hypothetical protein